MMRSRNYFTLLHAGWKAWHEYNGWFKSSIKSQSIFENGSWAKYYPEALSKFRGSFAVLKAVSYFYKQNSTMGIPAVVSQPLFHWRCSEVRGTDVEGSLSTVRVMLCWHEKMANLFILETTHMADTHQHLLLINREL